MYMRGISGKVKGHVAFVAVAEIVAHVLRPLIGLGEEHAVRVVLIDDLADALHDGVRLAQVLVGGAFALDQIGDRIQAQAVDPLVEPEIHDADDGALDVRVVEIQIGLMAEEAVPVIALRDRSKVQLELSVSVKMMRVPA